MSWHFSRALVAAFSAGTCSGGGLSAQSSLTPTPALFCASARMTAFSRLSRFGMTCALLTDDLGAELLTWFRAGFPARTFPVPERAPESKAHNQDSGGKWPESLAKYDQNLRSWRTHQCSLFGGLTAFSETWPRWGTMRAGELYPRPTPSGLEVLRREVDRLLAISANESGSWQRAPTPQSRDWKGQSQRGIHAPRDALPNTDDGMGRAIGGSLNPTWVEWYMGWPIGWTGLKPLATDRFQQWQRSHGRC